MSNLATIQQLHKEAVRHLQAGAFDAVDAVCQRILVHAPDHADALFLRGVAACARQRLREAIALMRRAIELDATKADYHAQLARCLVTTQEYADAIAAAERALQCQPAEALTFDTIANVFARANAHDRAAAVFARAVELAPRNAGYQFNLAASLKFTGDFAAADRAYEACINLDPHFWRAHSALAQLRKQTRESNHLSRLQRLLPETSRDADAELHIRQALAKEYEDLGDHAQAFEHLSAGRRRKRATLNYSSANDAALFEAVKRAFPQPVVDGPAREPCARPIFVIGMPRSGTTLVERILSSHSQVHSAGELQHLGLAVKRAAGTRSPKILDVETIERSRTIDFEALGKEYLRSTQPLAGSRPHFIDKMPLNFFYAAHIVKALPGARIVCLRRDALDTCLSNFRQLFAIGYSYYDYAYDLLDTGRYFLMFDQLIAHWREVLPGRVLEVHYEALVQDFAPQVRRVIDFCGLDWQEECLSFERNAAPVSTASAVQVRAPIYDSSIGRWRRYEKQLAPLVELFKAASGPFPREAGEGWDGGLQSQEPPS